MMLISIFKTVNYKNHKTVNL